MIKLKGYEINKNEIICLFDSRIDNDSQLQQALTDAINVIGDKFPGDDCIDNINIYNCLNSSFVKLNIKDSNSSKFDTNDEHLMELIDATTIAYENEENSNNKNSDDNRLIDNEAECLNDEENYLFVCYDVDTLYAAIICGCKYVGIYNNNYLVEGCPSLHLADYEIEVLDPVTYAHVLEYVE